MATLKVTEYVAAGRDVGGVGVPVGLEPALATQAVTYTTATTVTLNINTTLVRLKADAKAHISWDGGAAVAADPDIEANTPEYFGVAEPTGEGTSRVARTFSVYDGVT